MTKTEFTLDRLEAAARKVQTRLRPTAEISWPLLNARVGAEVWVKHENHNPTGAFKVRGGLVLMSELAERGVPAAGVITATRGNHGQSIGFAAKAFGIKTTIVVPEGNNPEKNAAMRALGVDLRIRGRDYQEAADWAAQEAENKGLLKLPTFHPSLVAGVASYSLEFLRAQPDLDTVYLPIGMGSGICGLCAARDALGLKTKIVGVVAEGAQAYALSFEAGRPVPTEGAETIADGMACRTPDESALAIILKGVDRIVRVSDDAIRDAIAAYYVDTHNLAEGAGAAPLAALLAERTRMRAKRVGLVLTGGNIDRQLMAEILSEGWRSPLEEPLSPQSGALTRSPAREDAA
ncbi:MAG: threonine dehydratase [Rhodospirillales bacterium]